MLDEPTIWGMDEGQSAKASWPRACAAFLLITALSAFFFRDAWSSMIGIWLNSSVYHQGALAAPISLAVIFSKRDWRHIEPNIDAIGVFPIALSCALYAIALALDANIIGHAAIVVALIGAAVFSFGREIASRWTFPLGFLIFMIPFGETFTPLLQQWTSAVAEAALNKFGIQTARDGYILSTAVGRFEVAESCAGLRFLLASVMISALVGYLAFESWRKRALFVLVSIAAALLANWTRTFLIILVATLSERRFGLGPEHVAAGWVFYGALVIALVAIAKRMADAPATNPIAFNCVGKT